MQPLTGCLQESGDHSFFSLLRIEAPHAALDRMGEAFRAREKLQPHVRERRC